MKLTVLVGGAIPPTLAVASMFGYITFDLALAGIGWMFAIALLPGVVQNYREKHGWSLQSTVMTCSGLLSMASIFYKLGVPITSVSTTLTGTMWAVLVAQTIYYGSVKKLPVRPTVCVHGKELCACRNAEATQ